MLIGAEGYELLRKYGIAVTAYQHIPKLSALELAGHKFGFPFVLKVISQNIIHKTELKAVTICKNLSDAEHEFIRLAKLSKQGYVLAQKFIDGQEVIIGAKRDSAFGHVVMFGSGGILAEVLADVSFRVCPITQRDADEMIKEVKVYNILAGVRSRPAVNFDSLKDSLVKASELAVKENIEELDINPFMINEKGGFAVDVRVV